MTDPKAIDISPEAVEGEREAIVAMVDDFHWILPIFKDAEINRVTDDVAESIREQIAAAIRARGEEKGQ